METFGEKISAEACSGKKIAGLTMMMNMMTRKSRVSGHVANWRQVGTS